MKNNDYTQETSKNEGKTNQIQAHQIHQLKITSNTHENNIISLLIKQNEALQQQVTIQTQEINRLTNLVAYLKTAIK